jgi:hypothetical protein
MISGIISVLFDFFKDKIFKIIGICIKRYCSFVKTIINFWVIKYKIFQLKRKDKKDGCRTAYCPKCGHIPSEYEMADSAITDREYFYYECKKCDKKYKMNVRTGEIIVVRSFLHDFR